MITFTLRPLLSLMAVLFLGTEPGVTQPEDNDDFRQRIVLVDLNVQNPADAPKCYSPAYDKKKVVLVVAIDDTLNSLQDFIFEEEEIESAGCFMPEMKIIYERYTYVVSFYCTSVIKFKNSKPFTPSNVRVENDLALTPTVLEYLKDMKKKHFGYSLDPGKTSKFFTTDPLPETEAIDENLLLEEEDEDTDIDLEKDAQDNEGWFDDSEPEIEVNDDINPDDL